MNGFFPLCYGIFPVCHCVYPFSSLSDPYGVTCELPVYGRIISCLFWTFSCHSHLGICASLQYLQSTVVDVLCAVSYTVAEDEWIFPLCYGFFPVCYGLHRAVV